MKLTSTTRNLLLTVVGLVIVGGIWFAYYHRTGAESLASSTATSSYTLPDGSVITLPAGATVQEETVPAPDYKKPLVFSASIDADARTALNTQFAGIVSTLNKNPSDFNSWVQLGILRKIGEDYKGAAEDWEYVAAAAPQNYIAFNNLADLYMSFLPDYPKAEADYKMVIALKPDYIDAYRNLFWLYTNLYKTNTSAAADIVALGLKNNPNNPDLLALQAQLQSGK